MQKTNATSASIISSLYRLSSQKHRIQEMANVRTYLHGLNATNCDPQSDTSIPVFHSSQTH